MANKTILDEGKMATFFQGVELGASLKGCCGSIGKSEAWLYTTIQKAEADIEEARRAEAEGEPIPEDTDEVKFLKRLKAAQAKFEQDNLAVIKAAAKTGSWSASAWLLERRMPKEYAAQRDVSVSGENLVIHMDVPKRGPNRARDGHAGEVSRPDAKGGRDA